MLLPIGVFSADDIAKKMSGYILLQVEENGEAWYVSPENNKRYYLGRPGDAFEVMRNQGIGITNKDIEKIPIGLKSMFGNDSDSDELSDEFENSINTDINKIDTDDDGYNDKEEVLNSYNPKGIGKLSIDENFSKAQIGKIFLQVENNGEAWYVYPENNKRYFLGRPEDAFEVMRELGLGITNQNLEKIIAFSSDYEISNIEQITHDLINEERKKEGLNELVWNDELAQVAREHSENLALENKDISGTGFTCDYPMIHHEGITFGLYNDKRLYNRDVHYFKLTGENISLIGGSRVKIYYQEGSIVEEELSKCSEDRQSKDDMFKEKLENVEDSEKESIIIQEVEKRKTDYKNLTPVEISEVEWYTDEEIAEKAVVGWMNSEGHRKNILTEEYDEAGIGSVYINGYVISTQVFITRIDCGFKNAVCCERNACYQPQVCQNNICQ